MSPGLNICRWDIIWLAKKRDHTSYVFTCVVFRVHFAKALVFGNRIPLEVIIPNWSLVIEKLSWHCPFMPLYAARHSLFRYGARTRWEIFREKSRGLEKANIALPLRVSISRPRARSHSQLAYFLPNIWAVRSSCKFWKCVVILGPCFVVFDSLCSPLYCVYQLNWNWISWLFVKNK